MKLFLKILVCSFSMLYACTIFAISPINKEASQIAEHNIMSLNSGMFSTLNEQEKYYEKELLKKHPVIVALFSSDGGYFVLYRPNKIPLIVSHILNSTEYKLAGAVEHNAMNVYEIAIAGMNNPEQRIFWQNKMKLIQTKILLAKKNINNLNISPREQDLFLSIMRKANTFIDANLQQESLSQSRTIKYAQAIKPDLVNLTQIIASEQVNFWMRTVANWKQQLGNEWGNTYAVVMYIPVEPKNNIFLAIVSHFMSQAAINQRLFYFNTNSFAPNTNEALSLLAKRLPDTNLANKVFGEYFLSYSDILSKIARKVVDENSNVAVKKQ